ncbi:MULTISPECIES: alpha/beta hydrolase [unclassified Streptomyces]|uniref:alpha/beta hydrolase n=1 Tax=unclassified Streptomyces TaxID=2593676 RepID=UPI002DDAA955|nr:alpha/beta hydrolase [Streptomyces sp. NBC_01775]WSB79861.1 esterase FrsA [Streptomyces sp. NBC_01775]WSS40646.1 esterase FrsA [Streptomyces sp. NBC_01187]
MSPQPSLAELRALAPLHARAQGIPRRRCRALLARIGSAADEGPDSWPAVWSRAGDALAARGRHLDAARHYALARFPYATGPAGERAQRLCVRSFDRWRTTYPGIGRVEVELPGGAGTFAAWTAGLSTAAPRPLIVVCGGIVSVKEQWAPLLARAAALGTAIAVTELPGVGENTLRYGTDSPAMFSALLDRLARHADVGRTHAVALSFGGHLALRAALTDPRLVGVSTVGAPVRHFFRDQDWQRTVPTTTTRTLAHLTGHPAPAAGVPASLGEWALEPSEVAALRELPVTYIAALRDEVVPLSDAALLARDPGARCELLVLDDEHGAPAHLPRVRATLLGSALRGLGVHPVRRAVLGLAGSRPGTRGGRVRL